MDNMIESQFIPGHAMPEALDRQAWVVALVDQKILLRKTAEGYAMPCIADAQDLHIEETHLDFLGKYDLHDCYFAELCGLDFEISDFELIGLREVTSYVDAKGIFQLAGTANQLIHWNRMNQFCGNCGNKTIRKTEVRAKECPNCGNIIYPRISPATITAITKGNEILLAHNRSFKRKFYSLVAGFVEAGETLEQCVRREIMEEVGIKVKNIRYLNSQPWPFPDSLMMAFTAEYDSGEIAVDNEEIDEASWFSPDQLPEIPNEDSIAGKIIRHFAAGKLDQYV